MDLEVNTFGKYVTLFSGSVRHTVHPKTNMPMVNVYEFLQAIGMSYDGARMALKTFMDGELQFRGNFSKLKFPPIPGSKQNHASWATDMETLYKLVMKQPKYSGPFVDFAAKCGVLVAGGSDAIRAAADEMEGVQQSLPENHPMRAFGRHAEHVDAGLRPKIESMNDRTYLHHRVNSADFFNDLRDTLHRYNVNGDRAFWSVLHGNISSTVLGQRPVAFMRDRGITDAKSSRDVMTKSQVAVVAAIQEMLIDMVPDFANTNGEEFLKESQKVTDDFFHTCARMHGKYQETTELKEVRGANSNDRPARITNVYNNNNNCTITYNNA